MSESPASFRPASFQVASLYHFAPVADVAALRAQILPQCLDLDLKGTILVAPEGLNGTIAGTAPAIDAAVLFLRSLPGFAEMDVKYSVAAEMPFLRMKVRMKREIVTMGVDGIDAAHDKGNYLNPDEWNAAIADPDTVVIDTRNDYEVAIGSFAGAINPQTESFRDFPAWFDEFAEKLREERQGKPPKIAMFCTGGIRCEKATAYVKAQGFDDVHHLRGGILRYLEHVPKPESQWQGDCFLFDQRVAVGHGLQESDYAQCHACRMPLNAEDRGSPHYVVGVSCPHCYEERSAEQRARYEERQRQVEMAQAKGRIHLGSDAVPAAHVSADTVSGTDDGFDLNAEIQADDDINEGLVTGYTRVSKP